MEVDPPDEENQINNTKLKFSYSIDRIPDNDTVNLTAFLASMLGGSSEEGGEAMEGGTKKAAKKK